MADVLTKQEAAALDRIMRRPMTMDELEMRAIIDRLCSLLAVPGEPEVEAVRERWTAQPGSPADLDPTNEEVDMRLVLRAYYAARADCDKYRIAMELAVADMETMCRERDLWRARFGEQARVDREVIADADRERDKARAERDRFKALLLDRPGVCIGDDDTVYVYQERTV